jgi:hypothetical protein
MSTNGEKQEHLSETSRRSLRGDDPKEKRDFFEEHRQIHMDLLEKERYKYLLEKMLNSGVMSDECYGINQAHAEEYIDAILGRLKENVEMKNMVVVKLSDFDLEPEENMNEDLLK